MRRVKIKFSFFELNSNSRFFKCLLGNERLLMELAMKKICWTLLVISTLFSGCGFYNEKNPGDPNSVADGSVNYARVSAEVFQRRCDLCHSLGGAGFNSSNYQSIVAMISQVQDRALTKKSMPTDSPLTPYEQKVLTVWIQDGTPQ